MTPSAPTQPLEDANARSLGFEYIENHQLLREGPQSFLYRLEALGRADFRQDPLAQRALLGLERKPTFLLSQLFVEYEAMTEVEGRDLSQDQLCIRRNGRQRAVERFVESGGDKLVTDITYDDGIKYCEWWWRPRHRRRS